MVYCEKKIEIKPITILLLIFLETFLLFKSTNIVYWILILMNFFILYVQNKKKIIILLTTFSILYSSVFVINSLIIISGWVGSIYTMILITVRLYPLWILSVVMSTYDTTDIMNSLRRVHIPNNICISIAIFFRFLPDYIDYFKEVREGLLVRNLKFDIFKVGRSIEVYIVPMINKSFKTSEIITVSLITKGIEYNCKKTEYSEMKLGFIDFIIMLSSSILLGTIWMK